MRGEGSPRAGEAARPGTGGHQAAVGRRGGQEVAAKFQRWSPEESAGQSAPVMLKEPRLPRTEVAELGCSRSAAAPRKAHPGLSRDARRPGGSGTPGTTPHPSTRAAAADPVVVVAVRSIARERARHAPVCVPSSFVCPCASVYPAERLRTRTAVPPDRDGAAPSRTAVLRTRTAGAGPGRRLSGRRRSRSVPRRRRSGRGRSLSVPGRGSPDADGAAPSRTERSPGEDGAAPSRRRAPDADGRVLEIARMRRSGRGWSRPDAGRERAVRDGFCRSGRGRRD